MEMDSFDLGVLNPGNVYLAYLPLAHIMELISEIHLIASRVLIIYGNPHTLSRCRSRGWGWGTMRSAVVSSLFLKKLFSGNASSSAVASLLARVLQLASAVRSGSGPLKQSARHAARHSALAAQCASAASDHAGWLRTTGRLGGSELIASANASTASV